MKKETKSKKVTKVAYTTDNVKTKKSIKKDIKAPKKSNKEAIQITIVYKDSFIGSLINKIKSFFKK